MTKEMYENLLERNELKRNIKNGVTMDILNEFIQFL